MAFTDEQVIEASIKANWTTAVFSLSGQVRQVALVMECTFPTTTGETMTQHLEHVILDHDVDATVWGRTACERFNAGLREGEPARHLVRAVEVGQTNVHVFTRMPASNDGGELFKCSHCGLTVNGQASMGFGAYTYILRPPHDSVARRRYFSPCSKNH
jgi:hypothetical protein